MRKNRVLSEIPWFHATILITMGSNLFTTQYNLHILRILYQWCAQKRLHIHEIAFLRRTFCSPLVFISVHRRLCVNIHAHTHSRQLVSLFGESNGTHTRDRESKSARSTWLHEKYKQWNWKWIFVPFGFCYALKLCCRNKNTHKLGRSTTVSHETSWIYEHSVGYSAWNSNSIVDFSFGEPFNDAKCWNWCAVCCMTICYPFIPLSPSINMLHNECECGATECRSFRIVVTLNANVTFAKRFGGMIFMVYGIGIFNEWIEARKLSDGDKTRSMGWISLTHSFAGPFIGITFHVWRFLSWKWRHEFSYWIGTKKFGGDENGHKRINYAFNMQLIWWVSVEITIFRCNYELG